MLFNQPLPRAKQPIRAEGSALASVRDDRNNSLQWKKDRTLQSQSNSDGAALVSIQQQLNKLKRRQTGYSQQVQNGYPFRVYPSTQNTINQGLIFDASGNSSPIAIDSTIPTNLPITVNPITDAWRFFNVRSGYVNFRPYYSIVTSGGSVSGLLGNLVDNYSVTLNVADGTDNIDPNIFPFLQFDSSSVVAQQLAPFQDVSPLIINGDYDSNSQIFFFIWIEITPDIDSSSGFSAAIKAHRWSNAGGAFTTQMMPEYSPFVIPIANISAMPPPAPAHTMFVNQIQFGHIALRYGQGMYDFTHPDTPSHSEDICSPANYRGDWDNDPITDQVFYPGDFVKIKSEIDFSASGGIVITPNKITSKNLWMQTSLGFTTDPTTDPTWTQISGVTLT